MVGEGGWSFEEGLAFAGSAGLATWAFVFELGLFVLEGFGICFVSAAGPPFVFWLGGVGESLELFAGELGADELVEFQEMFLLVLGDDVDDLFG